MAWQIRKMETDKLMDYVVTKKKYGGERISHVKPEEWEHDTMNIKEWDQFYE